MTPWPSLSEPDQTAVAARSMVMLLSLASVPRCALGNQDNFAEGRSVGCDRGLGAGSVRERNFLGDDGPQRLIFQAGGERRVDAERVLSGNVPERHAKDRGVAHHNFARIDFDVAAIADDDYAPAVREDGKVAR